MNRYFDNYPLLEMEYSPSILDEKEIGTLDKVPLATISAFGGSLATLPTSLRTITETVTTSGDGLYKAVFPDGVVGKMTKFKGMDAYTGNIQGVDGIAGRIRWTDAGDVTSKIKTTIPYDPTMIFMGMAIATIEKQLKDVKESQDLLLEIEEVENRTNLIGDLQFLNEIKDNFKFNWDNEVYLRENYGQILTIRREAKRKVFFYQELIKHENERKDLIHTDGDIKKKMKYLAKNFQNYQLARYIHSYSYLLEILTQHNYNENYLNSIVKEIRDYGIVFRELFTESYELLSEIAEDSIETLFLNYASKTNDKIGKVLESIPGIKKLEVGDNLQKMGEKIADFKSSKNTNLMHKFISEKSNEIIPFIETIEKLNEYHNKPQEIYFDKENVYIK